MMVPVINYMTPLKSMDEKKHLAFIIYKKKKIYPDFFPLETDQK